MVQISKYNVKTFDKLQKKGDNRDIEKHKGVCQMSVIKRWKWEENYLGEDFSDWYIIYSLPYEPSSVEEANFRYLERNYGDRLEKHSFGHYGGSFDQLLAPPTTSLELLSEIENLLSRAETVYPVLDDDIHSEVEHERSCALWDSVGVYYTIEALTEHLTEDEIEELKDLSSDLWEIVNHCFDGLPDEHDYSDFPIETSIENIGKIRKKLQKLH